MAEVKAKGINLVREPVPEQAVRKDALKGTGAGVFTPVPQTTRHVNRHRTDEPVSISRAGYLAFTDEYCPLPFFS
jgi:hypothetical protein